MRTLLILAALLFAGCSAAPLPETVSVTPGAPAATAVLPTPSAVFLPSPTALPSSPNPPEPANILPTATDASDLQVCSPLQDIALAQVGELISNPYHPPRPGSDDPHHGVDLADRLPGSQVAVEGRAVQSVLAGLVAAVIQDRFPYGSAILVETGLDALPAGWLERASIPTPAPTLAVISALTCPLAPEDFADRSSRSLYLLYAHLQHPPTLQVEDRVACGQTIGAVGSSGNALNPHLHFEARVGPAGLRPGSMAHYDASATLEEMSSYCLWRISGWFQLVDPLRVLSH